MTPPRPAGTARRGPNDPYLFRPVRRPPRARAVAPETRPHAVALRVRASAAQPTQAGPPGPSGPSGPGDRR